MNGPVLQINLLFWGETILKFTFYMLGVYTMVMAIKVFKIYISKNS